MTSYHSKNCLTHVVVNPEMLRSRSITFLVLMASYQVISVPSQTFFSTIFFLDGKRSCYGNLLVKMHGVPGIQARKF